MTYFKLKFGNDIRDEIWIGMSEKWNRLHEWAAIEVDHILENKQITIVILTVSIQNSIFLLKSFKFNGHMD